MKTTPATYTTQSYPVMNALQEAPYFKIEKYYDVAGPDYEMWSKNFNMHFGYYRKFSDLFLLERMLINMNDQVLKRLHTDTGKPSHIIDLGCGVGTVARHTAQKFPLSTITGITIVDSQIEKGRVLIRKDKLEAQVELKNENFEHLNFNDNTFTHAYAMESACHANGKGKELFIKEMARVLKPGGRFCIADGFIKHDGNHPRLFNYLYNKIKKYWALPCFATINEFEINLRKYGFTNIKIEEISMRIAPSVAYVPWTSIKFFATELWRNKSLHLKKERWHNVYAPVLGMILGLYRKHFGYYLISGCKK